ncbi:2-dehydropantoate 2-reductase [Dokdonia pacifica]|uniref:2-dehydropantoate 2-reductase n=1 Tax=Dokdonia pacifica TaxID=1627892 RepID=A0A238W618_9FLAO|nr:2-dehydropantoate 2-reductase [Dokdonia pacifica]GGG14708.1 2-dehydropantoate 2-reductase [Dokdonia pacifica]SNR41990.1 ketopantoate reductase [Dokdonia pacifica]
MKILIYGTGGVGGFIGGKLAQTQHQITLIARGAHLKAIQERGLQVQSITGDFTAHPHLATDDVSNIDTPDLVIFGTKSWQLKEASTVILQYTNKDTVFLPLQNGANNTAILNSVLPNEQVLSGLCRMISFIKSPGVISNPDIPPSFLFGEQDNTRTPRVTAILEVFKEAGLNANIPENIQVAIWQKFLFITTVSAIGGLTRASIGVMRDSPYIKDLMLKTAQEVYAVAHAKGIALPENTIDKAFAAIARQAPETTASTQRDLMEGKPSELENFNGFIVKEGKRVGVPTPVNEMIYQLLLPQENSARKG